MAKKILLFLLFIFYIASAYISFDNYTLEQKNISVEIKGAVKEEKVIKTHLGNTFYDVLEHIELLEDADLSKISLNQVLSNNQVIVIPYKQSKKLISINSASITDLKTLKGIGEGIAKRIVEYRESHGSFKTLEELKNVNGIGDKIYETIKEYISL